MTKYDIYLSPPHVGELERSLLNEAFDSNWIAPLGPFVDRFESDLCDVLEVSSAVALSSGTAALHLSLILSGVSPGDVVLCSTFTFAATANAIKYCGAEPVFIDSEPSSWNMDPNLLDEALKWLTAEGVLPKAVIAVDLYGQCCDYEKLAEICNRYEIPLIEDAAEALGARYQGQTAGSFGRLGVLSFNGNKIITTSGGGVLVSDDESLVARARHLATQARDPFPHYEHSEIGYNYRISNLLAAIGVAQLKSLEERVKRRREIFVRYQDGLDSLPGFSFQPEVENSYSTRWLTVVMIEPKAAGVNREDVRLALEQARIESRPVWKPMHMQPIFERCLVFGGAVSATIFENGLCLPSGSSLTDLQQERIISIIGSLVYR